jgi:hypothetical protein
MGEMTKLLRLRGATREALQQLGKATDANGLSDAYERYRAETRLAVDPVDLEEFDRVCPTVKLPRYHFPSAEMVTTYGEAKGLLAGLFGWLNGAVEAAEFEAQTRANAEARARDARGV